MAEPKEPAAWPGLQAERDGVTYSAEKITNIAKALAEELKPFNGQGAAETRRGSIDDLTTYGGLTELQGQLQTIDKWEGGKLFSDTLAQSHTEFLNVYRQVVDNFGIAISLVAAGAGNYPTATSATEGEV
ncbi:hypothetical protein [Nonomuraea sp. NPDC002799]